MTTYKRGENLNGEDMEFFGKSYKGLIPTGETIVKEWHGSEEWDNSMVSKVVFKGNWTPYGCIRDCGDHYIEALYSSYRWISKDLQTIKEDVADR